jgi:serine phosphatase RsbU (regulator of sigma subunit)
MLLAINRFGYFNITKHVGIILANLYVYFQSIVSGPELQFQYAYCIIITMIGFVFIQKKYLFIHFPITLAFFIFTKISYNYIEPIQYIPPADRDAFAYNNGIIFLVLISVAAIALRNQTNLYLKEIEDKKNVIEDKQKEIFDSITYAHRIQSAILANTKLLDQTINKENYFILFKPKDIVSGDFYWATTLNSKYKSTDSDFKLNKFDELFYFALCDSTGHGVPGAFMSILNMSFISEAIKERSIYEPNKVFDFVRKRLIESINSEEQKDGFDGVLMCVNKTTKQITYAGANNNPVLVSDNQLRNLPTDKMPVGKGEKTAPFNLFTIDYKTGDQLFLYSDGYADQFGGPKGKKFKYKPLEEMILNSHLKSVNEQKKILETTFENWRGKLEQVDDVVVVGIKL